MEEKCTCQIHYRQEIAQIGYAEIMESAVPEIVRCDYCAGLESRLAAVEEELANFQQYLNDKISHYAKVGAERLQRIAELEQEIADCKMENKRLREAALALVERMDFIHDNSTYMSVWTLHQLHHGPYSGPQYVAELERLREALHRQETQ